MRWLEVRRHWVTKKGPARDRGSHLSAQGVALARAVGAELGPIAYVVTSAAPRAIETAIAMGVAVDDTVDLPSGYVPGEVGFHEQWTWAKPWVRYAELLARGGGLAAVAEAHRAHGSGRWRRWPRGGRTGGVPWRRDRTDLGGLPAKRRPPALGSAAGPLRRRPPGVRGRLLCRPPLPQSTNHASTLSARMSPKSHSATGWCVHRQPGCNDRSRPRSFPA